MAFAFPIQQAPPLAKLLQTEIVFNEDEVSKNLLKGTEFTFDYLINKRYKDVNESANDIYLKRKLSELVFMLEKDSQFSSSISDILDNQYFQRIVSYGNDIIPTILEELKFNRTYLVWAMNLITGMKISSKRISLSEAARLWIIWGLANNYIKR